MNAPDLEYRLRAALQERADAAPDSGMWSAPASIPICLKRRLPLGRLLAAGAAAACLAVVVAMVTTNDRPASHVVAGPPASDALIPRLGFALAGFRFQRVQECDPTSVTTTDVVQGGRQHALVQTFGRSYTESPLLFIRTIELHERDGFGVLGPETGDPVTVRGVTGYAATSRGSDRGWILTVELPDGRTLYAIAIGLGLDEVTRVLDGLAPRSAGGWGPTVLPPGTTELQPSVAWDGCGYSAVGDLPNDAVGGFEVNLYDDKFDGRLADRASSTIGAIQAVSVDGVPGALGSYSESDHWVMFEPQPGRTMEIRASSMARADVLGILRHARFVDEVAWQTMQP